ncbi:MAG: HAD family hydrolase [Chloroflexi bacterium]|nr:HAD family hydrolase [Chloroflexota bacterium]
MNTQSVLEGFNPAPAAVTIEAVGQFCHVPSNSRCLSPNATSDARSRKAAVFLDRDGVLLEDVNFLTSPSEIRLLPGVTRALRALQDHFCVVVVTNQSGVARGLLTEADLLAIHLDLVRRLDAAGAVVDALYYCPHLPEAKVPEYRVECECRKPKPGMLRRAERDWNIDLARSFIVGDSPRDVEAGRRVGVKGTLLGAGHYTLPNACERAPDLATAAELILGSA